jgi:catalase
MLIRVVSAAVLASTLCTYGPASANSLTTDAGAPVGDNQNSQTVGRNGPTLLQDFHLIEKTARFDRERIPERVVHARGTGAMGVFESYGDFSAYTKAGFLASAAKKTPVLVRFSTVIHSQGSPETARDPRGFATKFYTEQGNYDLVGNNLPVFFIRDAMRFPDMVHSLKPSPIYNKQDPNRFFDFFSHQPESTNMLTYVYSDMGIPASYRKTDGFGVHSFKWINEKDQVVYVKYHWTSLQGVENYSAQQAAEVVGKNWENLTSDLYDNIRAGNFPSWELSVQILKPGQLNEFKFNPLDATKIWPEAQVPSVKIGKMTLNKIPDNFFEQVEQAAFDPGVMVPGIEPSEDKLLQGRLFSYADTQRYRVGANYQQLPVNHALSQVANNSQGGSMNASHTQSDINYEPTVANGRPSANADYKYHVTDVTATISQEKIDKPDDFEQAGALYRSFSEKDKSHLIDDLVADLSQVKNLDVTYAMVSHFFLADQDYGNRLADALKLDKSKVQQLASEKNAIAQR